MINFPHTLPLPDLSKQGRAEEQEAEGGEKAGEEPLGYSNCTSTLQLIPKQLHEDTIPPSGTGKGASQEQDRHSHTSLQVAKDLSLCLLAPMFCKPGKGPPFLTPQSLPPSSQPQQREGPPHSCPSPLLLPATQTVLCSNPISNDSSLKFCWTWKLRPFKGSNNGSRTALRARQEHWWHGARSVHPTLRGFTLWEGSKLCNPQAQAANRSLGGQPKEFCSPETDSRQLFKTQPKGLTLCFPYSTSPQEVPKHCAFI